VLSLTYAVVLRATYGAVTTRMAAAAARDTVELTGAERNA
jgi:hypothetical protein